MSIFYSLFVAISLLSTQAFAEKINGLYAAAYGQPNNPAILFLHGGPGYNSYSFEFTTAKTLSDRGYYVVVFDQRGCGRSDHTSESEYTFKNAVKDVRSIVKYYHLIRPTIIGHSYGGTLAIKYAQAYANDFKSIILADAPLDQPALVSDILDRCNEFYSTHADNINLNYILQIRNFIFGSGTYHIDQEHGGYVFYHATQCGLYTPKYPTPQRAALYQKLAQGPNPNLVTDTQPDPFGGLIQNDGWMTGNLTRDVSLIKNKISIIIGDDDGLFSEKQKDDFRTMFSDKFVAIPNASHNVFIDQQEAFLNFVDKVSY